MRLMLCCTRLVVALTSDGLCFCTYAARAYYHLNNLCLVQCIRGMIASFCKVMLYVSTVRILLD